MGSLSDKRKEFDNHVWNHSTDVFQEAFDFRQTLSPLELNILNILVNAMGESKKKFANVLTKEIETEPYSVLTILQVVGLTRSKILTDLKAMGLAVSSKPEGLINKKETWKVAVEYLAVRLSKVLKPMVQLPRESRNVAFEALNQATWPGWIRQERAKRQGHEAEGRIAQLLFNLGLVFEPKAKATNPMCRDIQIDSVSFDLISPSINQVGLCIKSTVQTSNIGQFGESKGALEIIEAKEMLERKYKGKEVILMAMVDGVGFQTNTAGLHGILENASEFCQFKTIWKAAVVAAHTQGKKVALNIPDPNQHKEFLDKYSSSIKFTDENQLGVMLEAGEGFIRPVTKSLS